MNILFIYRVKQLFQSFFREPAKRIVFPEPLEAGFDNLSNYVGIEVQEVEGIALMRQKLQSKEHNHEVAAMRT